VRAVRAGAVAQEHGAIEAGVAVLSRRDDEVGVARVVELCGDDLDGSGAGGVVRARTERERGGGGAAGGETGEGDERNEPRASVRGGHASHVAERQRA
jgi:hypothetical protein